MTYPFRPSWCIFDRGSIKMLMEVGSVAKRCNDGVYVLWRGFLVWMEELKTKIAERFHEFDLSVHD